MKKISIMLLLLVAISALCIVGCSDDDEKTIVAAATTQGWILAEAYLDPGLRFYADIMKITHNTFEVDSVAVGTSIVDYDYDYEYWYVYGDGLYDYVSYNNQADSANYSSGDMLNITFYKDNSSTTTSVKLLDRNDDRPVYVTPTDNDTLALGSSIDFTWNSIPNADWYGLYVRYYKDSAGTYVSNDRLYTTTTDTIYNVPSTHTTYDGYYRIYVVAVNGPNVGDNPNIDGLGLKGEIFSESYSASIRIYLGTGDPTPVGGHQEDEIVDLTTIGKQIISEVRKHPKTTKVNNNQ